MKLLNELITLRRVEKEWPECPSCGFEHGPYDDCHHPDDELTSAGNLPDPEQENEECSCPTCKCNPCLCDHFEDEEVKDDPRAEGYRAYEDGLRRDRCPYDKGTEECDAWMMGWDDADGDYNARKQDDWQDWEDEEDNLGKYDQAGTATQGAPVDSEPTDDDAQMGDTEDLDLGGDDESTEEDPALDAMANKATEDPDRQGLIRKVPSAHLVYKRQTEEGNYEELWVYNVGGMKDELEVRKAILAGTDIPVNKTRSPDGSQTYEVWTSGNVEMLLVKGLPN